MPSANEQDCGWQRALAQPNEGPVTCQLPGQQQLQGEEREGGGGDPEHLLQPGGGQVKIENRKLEWSAAPKTKVFNESYTPGGGDKKVRTSE